MSEINITFDNFNVLKKRNLHADCNVSLYAERFSIGSKGIKLNERDETLRMKFGVSKREEMVSSRTRINNMSGTMG